MPCCQCSAESAVTEIENRSSSRGSVIASWAMTEAANERIASAQSASRRAPRAQRFHRLVRGANDERFGRKIRPASLPTEMKSAQTFRRDACALPTASSQAEAPPTIAQNVATKIAADYKCVWRIGSSCLMAASERRKTRSNKELRSIVSARIRNGSRPRPIRRRIRRS